MQRHGGLAIIGPMRRDPWAGPEAGACAPSTAAVRSHDMTATADRHLLFGLLALQNGLIGQGQLVAAFQAWTRDKSRPLADHLAAAGALDAEGRAVVEAMVALHVRRHGGDAQRSLAAVRAGRSTRESLALIDDPDVGTTLEHVGS